ncbi:MAG: NTP transferase domain-containing protein [Actinomycetaceae bacterium]|nr:NTP transferase domain-containing protein [Actinomycetaceae bacterium]
MTRRAIILAGGRGTRLGGASKADIIRGGISLLARLSTELARCGSAQQVCVGPESIAIPPGMTRTCEEPAEGGPVAGIVWGMDALGLLEEPTGTLAVFSVDAPGAASAAPRLFEALEGNLDADAAMLVDREGRHHHLIAVYRAHALANRIRALATSMPADSGPWFAGVRDMAAKHLVRGFDVVEVAEQGISHPESRDIDTPEDLTIWGARIGQ